MSELHIYAQEQWHSSSYIVGDRDALLSLRQAITDALNVKSSLQSKAEFFCADGEGYQLYIKVASPELMDKMELPYTGDVNPYQGKRHPISVFKAFPSK